MTDEILVTEALFLILGAAYFFWRIHDLRKQDEGRK